MASLKIIVSISDRASNKFTGLAKRLGNLDKRMNNLNRQHKKALTDKYNPTPMRRRLKGVNTLHRSLRYTNVMKQKAFTDNYKPSSMLKRINHVRQYRNGLSQAHRIARTGIRLPITANMNALNGLERRMSRLRVGRVRLRATDEVSPVMQRISGMLARIRRVPAIAIRARDGATNVINRVLSGAGRIRTSYTTRLNAIDRFTGPLQRAGGMMRNFAGRTFTSTIRVLDMATRPLQSIAQTAFSTLGLLGVTGGAVGGIMIPLKAVADRQDVTTQFEVMLGGQDQATQRVDELTEFAGSTPFLRDDIFEASRVLQTFTGDALATGDGLQLIGDVAAGTKRPINEVAMWFGRLYDGLQSGRPVGDATMALQEMGAMSGETRNMIEELAESGQDISEIWPQVTDEFSTYDNMMERMSENLNNLLLGVRSFITNTLMMPWGEGLESALGPALMAFREWRGENGDIMQGISDDLESWGSDVGDIIATPFYGLGSLFDEAFKNEDLDGLGEQLKYVVSGAIDNTNEWLQSTGIDKISGFMGSIGETYGGGLNKIINGLMGTGDGEDDIFTTLGELGRESAVAFGKAFVEELDPADLIKKAFGKVGEINVGGFKDLFGRITGDEELQSQGNIWGTLLMDAMLLAMATRFIPGFKGILAGLGTLGGGLLTGLFGKSKGKGGKGFFKGGLIGALFGGVKKIDFKKIFGGLKNIKLPKGLGKLLTGFKGIPLVGALAGAFGLITGDAENMGETIGTILGGLGGGALGSLLGPGGTAIGGILGALGGEKLGELWDTGVIQEKWAGLSSWFTENVWSPVKNGASSTWESISNSTSGARERIGNVLSEIGGVFRNVWDGIKEWWSGNSESIITPITNSFDTAKEWIGIALSSIGVFFSDTFSGILEWWSNNGEGITNGVSSAFEWMSETIGLVMDSIASYVEFGWNNLQGIFEIGAPVVSHIWDVLWTGIRNVVDIVWPVIQGVVEFGISFVQSLFETFAPIVSGIWNTLWTGLQFYAGTAWDGIKGIVSVGSDFIQTVIKTATAIIDGDWSTAWGEIKGFTSRSFETIKGLFSNLKERAVEIIGGLVEGAVTWFSEMWSSITTTASDIWSSVTSYFGDMKTGAVNRVTEMYNSVTGWFSDLWSDTTTKASNIWTDVTTSFTSIKDDTIESARGMWSGITGFFDDIWDDATSLFDDLVEGARDLPGRIGDAISNMASKAVDGASSMGNSIMSKLDEVLNGGIISGLNSVLDALNVSTIDEINIPTFSTGTSNGRISRDTPGILNDRGPGNGRGGATQELIERRGKLLMPRGKNALVGLKRGDKIYNGAQTQSIFDSNPFPHFSEGTVPGEDAGSGAEKKGLLGTLADVVSNVWDYVTSPKKAFNAIVDSVSPDFSGFGGFPGKMLNGVWNTIKDGGLKFLTGIFKDNEGGNVDGSSILGKTILQPFGRYIGGIMFNGGRHYGIDTNHKFDPVLSPASGKVTRVWNDYGGGNSLELTNARHIWWFMHLSKILKSVGDMVKTGDHIATSGNSGNYVVGSGHLHTQVHNRSTGAGNQNAINPMPILKGHATGGYVTNRTLSYIGENGNEFVIPVERNRAQGRMYLSRAANMLGMRVTPASENMNKADQRVGKIIDFNKYYYERNSGEGRGSDRIEIPKPKPQPSRGGGNKEVNINFTGDIHVRNEEDIEKIAERVKRSIISEIDEEYPDGEVM